MPSSYLLAIDVGNTATSFGFFSLKKKSSFPQPIDVTTYRTNLLDSRLSIAKIVSQKCRKRKIDPKEVKAIISSVVPTINMKMKAALSKSLKIKTHFVTAKSKSQIKIKYRNPSEVGSDRIVNARAGVALTKRPLIIIDFGTATTFDCVSAKKEYLGGVIAPGPMISAEALYKKTAKLPLVALEKPVKILGQNTLESIQSGLFHGYRGLVKEIVTQLKKKLGPKTSVIATGGQAKWILKGLHFVDQHIPQLNLIGLYFYWIDIS